MTRRAGVLVARRYLWLLTVTVAVLSVRSQLPPQECFREAQNTGRIACKDEDLKGLASNVFGSTISATVSSQIKSVELENCMIDNLTFLNGLTKLESLILRSINGLANDHIRVLQRRRSTLQSLYIYDTVTLTSIEGLVTGTRQLWGALNTLVVRGCSLDSVSGMVIERTPYVQTYDFSTNSLRSLDFSRHVAKTRVKKIYVRNNQLREIKGLEGFLEPEEINLSDNQLQDVTEFIDTLLSRASLTKLILARNSIRSLVLEPSDGSHVIDEVDFEDNSIQTISDLGEGNLKQVRKLNLAKNGDLKLTPKSFSGMTELRELNLERIGSSLRQVTTHFTDLPSLQKLYVQGNSIQSMSVTTFEGSESLQGLMLQDNTLIGLQFLTAGEIILPQLTYLDVSRNRLSNLENLVGAPKLEQLRMSGSSSTNSFSLLSSCNNKTIPKTLKIVCAMDVPDSCKFRSFIDLIKNQVLFNNRACCDNPQHPCCRNPKDCNSDLPSADLGCKGDVCTIEALPPGGEDVKGTIDETTEKCGERAAFADLKDSEMFVMILGYLLALVFFIMAVILFLRRYRSYDKWLKDYRDGDDIPETMMSPEQTRMNNEEFDVVDHPSASKHGSPSPRLPKNGVISTKSIDAVSIASGQSHYSTIGKGAFSGRNKFKDTHMIEMDNRYTGPVKKSYSQESGEDSPTAMSVYSYAGFQNDRLMTPPADRRRHRSGGSVSVSQRARARSRSEDFLDTASIDSDLIPPKIHLQRKATEKGGQPGSGNIRNTRNYSSTPHRGKGRAKKKSVSPLLTVKQLHRNPGAPTPPMSRRALPAVPTSDSPLSKKSASSFVSSGSSIGRKNSVFMMDDDDFVTTETIEGWA